MSDEHPTLGEQNAWLAGTAHGYGVALRMLRGQLLSPAQLADIVAELEYCRKMSTLRFYKREKQIGYTIGEDQVALGESLQRAGDHEDEDEDDD